MTQVIFITPINTIQYGNIKKDENIGSYLQNRLKPEKKHTVDS